jgi:hypothetical protein
VLLAPVDPPIGAGDTAGGRITRVLDRVAWTGPRNVPATGPPMAPTGFTDPPGVEMQNAADAGRFQFWIGADGSVNAATYLMDATPVPPAEVVWACTTGAIAVDATFAVDTLQLRNVVDATAVNGIVQRVLEQGSIQRYGAHAASYALGWRDQPDALAWAQWVLSRLAAPVLRVDRLDAIPQADRTGRTWNAVARVAPRLVCRVTIGTGPARFDVTVWVRGYQHTVTAQEWRVAMVTSVLSTADVGPWWTLSHPTFGRLGNRLGPSSEED